MGTNQGAYDSDLLVVGALVSAFFQLHSELDFVNGSPTTAVPYGSNSSKSFEPIDFVSKRYFNNVLSVSAGTKFFNPCIKVV